MAVHRQVLVWLCQELVLWRIATDHSTAFRPRRNYRSSPKGAEKRLLMTTDV